MKLTAILLAAALVCAGIGWAAYQGTLSPERPLSPYVPAGALIYLDAEDFSSLLSNWNSSPQKKLWLKSDNYEVFSRSRLFTRLQGAGNQFATAAGLPPSMDFLSQVAGTHSVLALYDIGNLQFLYITHLPSARSSETALWQIRSKFEPRNAGGVDFYVRRDPESKREVAFAVSGEYLLLATREDLLAGALQLMAGSKDRTLETESWWSQSIAAAGPAGELRMVQNLEALVPSPYFRTYWVQQNITDLKQYAASVCDLFRSAGEYREERVLIRKSANTNAGAPADAATAAADLTRLVPDGTGLYAATAAPSADAAFYLLETKLLAPHLGPAPASEDAPTVQLGSGETGSGSDLETRIDQADVQRPATTKNTSVLKTLLDKTPLLASLVAQTTVRDQAGVFVRMHSSVALIAASDWSEAEVQSALTDFVRPGLTASQLGVTWQQKSGYQEFDGLWPLVASVRGKYLLVSDDRALLEAMLANFNRKADQKPATFLAGFNHRSERANFVRFTGVVDRPSQATREFPGAERQPQFFSENMASFSSTLAGVASENIVVRAEEGRVRQTVIYEWSR